MAMIETWFSQDLNEPVQVHQLDGNVFSQDNQGNLIGVNVFDGDEPATLSGSVSASVIRSDGSTVAVTGVLSGNSCYIILPAAAYAIPGIISIVIKLTGGGSTTTICAVVANVYQSATDATVDPGTIIPSIETLIAEIQQAVATIPSEYAELSNGLTDNGFAVSAWENGSISDLTGANVSSTARIRTMGYIPRTSRFIWSENQSGNFGLYAWDKNGNFVGLWKASISNFINDGSATFSYTINMDYLYNIPAFDGYQYKLVYRLSNGNVQIDTVSGVHIDTYMQDLPKIEQNKIAVRVENNSKAENINSSLLWEIGAISYTSGYNLFSYSRARTRVFLPTNSGLFSFETQSSIRGLFLLAYDVFGNFIGVYKKSTETFVTDGTGTGYNTETTPFDVGYFMRKYPGYRFRFHVYIRNSGADIAETDFTLWTMTSVLNDDDYAKIRVIQYNIGKFNWGIAGGLSTDVAQKIMNYKEFFAGANADFICLQEYVPYIDANEEYPTDSTLFTPVMLEKSYSEHETVIFGQRKIRNSQFTYIHTSGDNPAMVIFGETTIAGRRVAIASGVLNSSAPEGIDHQQQGIRALTKLTEQILNVYEYAIVCMDCNTISASESAAFLSFMTGKGYRSGNWDYFGYKNTYNLSSSLYHAIDNVFVKGDMKIVGFEVPDVYTILSSDHFPVIADIRIK